MDVKTHCLYFLLPTEADLIHNKSLKDIAPFTGKITS